GVVGARAHRDADRRSWRALVALIVCGSVGVAFYLNLRAGPSFGVGVLPDDALHEARERDYFFVLGFWTWGAWAALGAVRLATAVGARRVGFAVAALPALLNWRATNRRGEPEASTAAAVGAEMLRSAPPRAVLFTAGDNDSYPLWYAQLAGGLRQDVTVVTIPLLGAPWYRAELARRDTLITRDAVAPWRGEPAAIRAVAEGARRLGRPVAASAAVPAAEREAAAAAGELWSLRGLTWVARRGVDRADDASAAPWTSAEDSAVTAGVADRLRRVVSLVPRPSPDGAPRAMQTMLGCPALALDAAGVGGVQRPAAAPDSASGVLLDSRCNRR
ncbi:MAG TPA: hypothetical protein VFJ74_07030, partial [Gemmatimonadaceae bacterium]|nr:hypothetical protein [Gemmatimonadaceae bacterium]